MDNWALIVLVAGGLFAAGFIIKTLIGLGLQYVAFIALAGFVLVKREGPDVPLAEPEVLAGLAIASAVSFGVTLTIITLFFRKSAWRLVVFPLVGVGATIASVAAVLP